MKKKLSHLDDGGRAQMVDVGGKKISRRVAKSGGYITMSAAAFRLLKKGEAAKGDVLTVAKIAAVAAAKKTAEWIPLCHSLPLESLTVEFLLDDKKHRVECKVTVATTAKTGAEMESLVALQAALLTVYDMLKAADKSMTITDCRLLEKSGGKSGKYQAKV